jgi:hypothetical protein
MKIIKIASIAKTATLAAIAGAVALGLAIPAEAASGTMYGDPVAAAKYWRLQTYDDCAIMSAADVVGQVTGKEPAEEAIIKVAQSTPSKYHSGSIYVKPVDQKHPNSGNGTNTWDLPTLLKQYKIDAIATDQDDVAKNGIKPGIEGLEQLLNSKRKVIVSLNAEMIWHKPIENKDSKGNPRSDHAVVVTGIDTANGIVHLNDSGTAKGKDEQIPLALFVQAWNTSHNLVITTT